MLREHASALVFLHLLFMDICLSCASVTVYVCVVFQPFSVFPAKRAGVCVKVKVKDIRHFSHLRQHNRRVSKGKRATMKARCGREKEKVKV